MSEVKLPRKIFKKGDISLRILNDGTFIIFNKDKEVYSNYSFNGIRGIICDLVEKTNIDLCRNNRFSACSSCWLGCGWTR